VGVDSITVTEPAKPAETKPEFIAQRASFTDADIRVCANELREMIKTSGPMDEQDVRNWYQSKMPAKKKVSATRWNRLFMYSELRCKDGQVYEENPEGYVEEPVEQETQPATPETVPGLDQAKRIENFAKAAPAICDRLVLVVGAHFNDTPKNAHKFNKWIRPCIEILEKRHRKTWSALRLDFGKAEKYLEGELQKAVDKETPVGLIIANRTDPLLSVALPILERAGALIIWGR